MGIVIKGGSTVVGGKGKTNIGPSIPTDGLVAIIDPSLAETATSAYRIYTPLTSSILTATSANIDPGSGTLPIGLIRCPYPTGAGAFAYADTGSTGTFVSISGSRQSYIEIQGTLLNYLRANVQNQATILYWYSGVTPGISYPGVFTDTYANYKFGFRTNVSPAPDFYPTNESNTTQLSSRMTIGLSQYGASTYRIWDGRRLGSAPFSTTGSMTTTGISNIPSTVFWGFASVFPNTTNPVTPSYTGHPAVPNPPTFHRLLPTSVFRGREVYRDLDGWNCFAMTLNQTDRAVTSSVYINGGLFSQETAITSSRTSGARSRGVFTNFNSTIDNTNTNHFFFSGSLLSTSRIRIFPTSSGTFADTGSFSATVRTFYCASGSTINETLQNVVNKINSTEGLNTFFTASFASPSGISISSSFEGTQYNDALTFHYSSSTERQLLFTFANGTATGGSGPITTTLLQEVPNGDTLVIGAYEREYFQNYYRGGLVGLLGATYIYSRVLTQEEITQFYDALKSKYGNTAPGNTSKRTYRLFNSIVSSSAGLSESPSPNSGIGY